MYREYCVGLGLKVKSIDPQSWFRPSPGQGRQLQNTHNSQSHTGLFENDNTLFSIGTSGHDL